MSIYEITSMGSYRGHRQGSRVEMVLAPMVEERAIRRGNIALIERSTPSLREGSYRLPRKAADAAERRGSDDPPSSDKGGRADRR